VYSLAQGTPIKQTGFSAQLGAFEGTASYREWKFLTTVPYQPAPPPQSPRPENVPSAGNPPPTEEPAVPPPPPAPKPRTRDCAKMNAFDTYTCEEQRARWGETTVNECLDSAQRRLNACQSGDKDLPMLYIRHQ
jgi:hypothetical protein